MLLKQFKSHLISKKNALSTLKNLRFINSVQKFNFSKSAEKLPVMDSGVAQKRANSSQTSIQPWVEMENHIMRTRNELVLSDHDKIEKYVLSVVKGYFRTTYKDGITLNSNLSEHGLDSLDSIELGMILEDELGYIIEAEVLPKFAKPKHYVNYIKQMEAYKAEFHMLPQEIAQKDEENWDNYLPFGEKLKAKLFSYTKKTESVGGKKGAAESKKEKH
jgi:acyl carrier protein